jgi:hypothetical protein
MTAPITARIITKLRRSQCTARELSTMLHIEPAAIRAAIDSMADLVEFRRNTAGKRKYRLISNAALVDAYLASIGKQPMATRSRIADAKADPTRHVHICPDDEAVTVRVSRWATMCDPMALPVEFFRAGQRP